MTDGPTEELKYTNYNSLFKAQYKDLRNDISKGYLIAEKALAPVADAVITGHRCVDLERGGEVFLTEYDNGVKIFVNYRSMPFPAEEGTVPALGILVVNGSSAEPVTVGK